MPTPEDLPPAEAAASRQLLPWLVAVAFFMQALDTTILNTAVPGIAHALGVAPLSMKAVLSSYTLSLAVFIPISGWMANRFGTRRVFAGAIGLFTLGSLLCGVARNIHWLVAFRVLQGCGGAMMVPVGRLTLVRSFGKSELVRAMSFVAVPGLLGPLFGPLAGGLITGYAHWSVIFFINVPIGMAGLYLVRRYLPDYREAQTPRLDLVGLILFGAGIALLSYVLEVFGEHSLSSAEVIGLLLLSLTLLAGYGLHAARSLYPLLNLALFRIRTFRAAVSGGFFTRISISGIPFLLPLLFQVGLGYTPIQSGLLMMSQAFAAMGLKTLMPRILARFGYRAVLVSNTVMLGLLILLFATIGRATPVWVIVLQVFAFGLFASLQYTSMNTLVYADVSGAAASDASTIASTGQQLSISFAVALASLVTALFVPDRFHTAPGELLTGIHEALLVLGVATLISTLVFYGLKRDDGSAVSRHQESARAA
ncbi:MAG TPA: DHA2 family efflux MFS transporter permease subunit [Steroidobacteraceae bacterium]|jgi:EmrB/QacA subfamily drug resistance transporter|nr:DHA2 family efflux MFS transporter permease subunit [Steroidobacteraceae bacterium]